MKEREGDGKTRQTEEEKYARSADNVIEQFTFFFVATFFSIIRIGWNRRKTELILNSNADCCYCRECDE